MPNVRRQPEPTSFPLTLGELFETHGWQRLVGRVLGELLLAEPPYLSTEQLCQRIGVSKSHLSSAVNALETMQMIDRFGVPGTRQHHYRLRDNAFVRAMEGAAEPSAAWAAAADRALADVPPDSRAARELARLRDFYQFLARRFPELVREFEDGAR